MENCVIVGLGNKARAGKDTIGNFMKEYLADKCKVLHFADALKQEVANHGNDYPLIQQYYDVIKRYFYVIEGKHTLYQEECKMLHDIFMERGITKYQGSDIKDPLILQWWGTDYRRYFFDEDYWVKRVEEKITEDTIIIIPDCRFKNEYKWIKSHKNGIYVQVNRTNDDDTIYIDPNRDPNHPSEIDLDGIAFDYEVSAHSGEIIKLQNFAYELSHELLRKIQE